MPSAGIGMERFFGAVDDRFATAHLPLIQARLLPALHPTLCDALAPANALMQFAAIAAMRREVVCANRSIQGDVSYGCSQADYNCRGIWNRYRFCLSARLRGRYVDSGRADEHRPRLSHGDVAAQRQSTRGRGAQLEF